MTHQLLLISEDAALASRLRQALPAGLAVALGQSAGYQPCPDRRGWLLVLVDARALPAHLERESAPVIWIGGPPRLTETGGWEPGLASRIADYVSRHEAPSKWALILHQHVAAAYLHRMRAALPETAGEAADELQRQLNNALTGILGNAGLAMAANRRLPLPLYRRLQRIAELASQMRDALGALRPGEALPPGLTGR